MKIFFNWIKKNQLWLAIFLLTGVLVKQQIQIDNFAPNQGETSYGAYIPGAASAIAAMKAGSNTSVKWNGSSFVSVELDTVAEYLLANPEPGQPFEIAGPLTLANAVDTTYSISPQNNLDVFGLDQTSLLKIDPDQNINITGIVAKPEGTVLYIFCDDTDADGKAISLRAFDGDSAAANQFGIDGNFNVDPNSTVAVIYISGKWRLL